MSGKRAHSGTGVPGDDPDSKRMRGNDGSPAPPPAQAMSELTEKEKKSADTKARIAALKERMKTGAPPPPPPRTPAVAAPSPTPPPPPPAQAPPASDAEAKKAAAAERIAAFKASMAAKQKANGTAPPASNSTQAAMHQRIKEQKEQRYGRCSVGTFVHSVLTLRPRRLQDEKEQAAARARSDTPGTSHSPSQQEETRPAPRTGLKHAPLHPLLMGDTVAPSTGKGPKFSTMKGNQAPKVNPYLADFENDDAGKKGLERERKKGLTFAAPGKHIRQANALRDQLALEEMKARIAAETRRTEIEEASDRSLLVSEPPEVEWWDEGLLPLEQNSYDDWENPARNRIENTEENGSIITNLVQHPRLDEPPQDKFAPPPKPMMLTAKEQAKVRRQRRMADMKEEQAKVRLGLVEPPPPKVKKSNMMRVLGEEAVKDPTAVEARVNREIAAREAGHVANNEERKLTKEQRQEKLKQQQAGDEALGIRIAVFRVLSLVSGKHRFAVDINAKQNNCTGIVVLHPSMSLIVVEGGAHSLKNYRKALHRIRWTENLAPQSTSENSTATTFIGNKANQERAEDRGFDRGWLSPWSEATDFGGNFLLKDLSDNTCVEVWEGEMKERKFRRWESRICGTDGEAMEVLRRANMENMWTLAKNVEGGLPEVPVGSTAMDT
ncbi:hypothetical protein MBLNU230_g0829t1 [Neophaeotheca triangularis]